MGRVKNLPKFIHLKIPFRYSVNFLQLITDIHKKKIKVLVFFGPEEKKLIKYFSQKLGKDIPLVFEPSIRIFSSMVSS